MLRSTACVFRFGLTPLGCALAFVPGSQAQVFGSGPSDSALFTTVINLPPDPNIGELQTLGSSTQLNVAGGGSVGDDLDANAGSEVNISGGTVGDGFFANFGSEVNISGGTVGNSFAANAGSEVNISGGTVGDNFDANFGSVVNIRGGSVGGFFDAFAGSEVSFFGTEFRLNGSLLDALAADQSFVVTESIDTLSAVLVDGSLFDIGFDSFIESGATVTLTRVAIPEPASAALLLGAMGMLGIYRRR